MRFVFVLAMFLPFASIEAEDFESRGIRLSQMASEEVSIISRLQRLREATENLSSDFQAPSFDDPSVQINRDTLVRELVQLELSAARRWNILVNNLALLREKPEEMDQRAKHWKNQLKSLSREHEEMNQRLDLYNSRLKEGILMNLAQQIELSPVE